MAINENRMTKVKQEIHRDGYKKTTLGWIPVGWEISNIEKSCQILSGGTPKKDEDKFWSGNIPWYSAKDLKSF
ncbi:MAG: hypothetical protein H6573_06805 [Lewinellaceae bacterium]|nr:hypothetical protein [Lewinellaceae bacterium]